MVETVLAVLFITALFLCLFRLAHLLTGKILLEHAAMRVARARSVGMNAFMCEKVSRVATIPVAGRRLWPDDDLDAAMELSRVPIYLGAPNAAVARGVFEFEGWRRLTVDPALGGMCRVSLGLSLFADDEGMGGEAFRLEGSARVEDNCSLYMIDQNR